MNDATSISFTIKLAFAAANVLVWTGLFLYLLRLSKKVRRLEDERSGDRKAGPGGTDRGGSARRLRLTRGRRPRGR